MRALSLLAFHDSVELFLALAGEELGVNCNNTNFIQYWERLAPKKQLTQKEGMRGLNSARNALKHEGRFPSSLDIEGYRASTTNFFKENTLPVFSIDFSGITLTSLVTCADARVSLETVEQLMRDSKFEASVSKTAIAFLQLINDYQNRAALQAIS